MPRMLEEDEFKVQDGAYLVPASDLTLLPATTEPLVPLDSDHR